MRPDVHSWQSSNPNSLTEQSPECDRLAFTWLATPSVVLGLIGAYLFGHAALRLMLSPTLGIDDAEQILFAQHWAFGYRFRQPPLFTWLLLPTIEIVGPGVLAISIVRYALLAITYVFFYLTARLCLDDQRMAGLSVLSFALIYVFAYYAHHDLTHTTALGAMIALALYVMARLAKHPSCLAYGILGLVFGLGMLAKWNFLMLAIGLPITCLLLPTYRHLVSTPKILLAIAVMAVAITPTALWMFAHEQSVQGLSSDILAQDSDVAPTVLWLEGSAALARSTLLFPLPFLPIFLVFFGRRLRSNQGSRESQSAPALTPAFFGSLMLIILALHVTLIPVFGAVNFTERWLHPALMVLPIFLFALAERGLPESREIAGFVAAVAILVVVAAGARLYRYADGADACGRCREFAPFAELADGLRKAGFSGGTIVADGMHLGGNLKVHFADSLIIDPAFPRMLWPDTGERETPGTCLLIWRDDRENPRARRDLAKTYATTNLGLAETAVPDAGRLDALLLGSATRRYALGYELYRETSGGCR